MIPTASTAQALCEQGQALLQAGNTGTARSLFSAALMAAPDLSAGWFGLAACQMAANERPDAMLALMRGYTLAAATPEAAGVAATLLAGWSSVDGLDRAALELTGDGRRAAALIASLAVRGEGALRRSRGVRQALWRQALALEPGNRFYRTSLLKECEAAKDYETIVAVLDILPPTTLSAQERAQLDLAQVNRNDMASAARESSLAKQAEAAGDSATAARHRLRQLVHKRIAKNRAVVSEGRRSRYMDFPAYLHLETLAVCNAACGFCPYPTIDRKGARMPDGLIDRILTDLEAVPSDLPFSIAPFKVSDPFIDKRLFDLIERVERRLPSAQIRLISNGSTISEKHIDRLARARNISELSLSLNDHRPQEYQTLMRLPFARTFARLQAIHRRYAAGDLRFRVRITRVADGTAVDTEFVRWVQHEFPRFEVSFIPTNDWIGTVDVPASSGGIPEIGCNRWFTMSITATGKVAICCMDGNETHIIGDTTTQNVLDIYNAPSYRALREKARTRLEAGPPCNTCTYV